jgi:hypothetical protein
MHTHRVQLKIKVKKITLQKPNRGEGEEDCLAAAHRNLCCKRAMKLMKIYCVDYDLWTFLLPAFLLLALRINWNSLTRLRRRF